MTAGKGPPGRHRRRSDCGSRRANAAGRSGTTPVDGQPFAVRWRVRVRVREKEAGRNQLGKIAEGNAAMRSEVAGMAKDLVTIAAKMRDVAKDKPHSPKVAPRQSALALSWMPSSIPPLVSSLPPLASLRLGRGLFGA